MKGILICKRKTQKLTYTNAAGDLYIEEMEKEMKPILSVITMVENGQETAAGEFDTSDFLLNTVVGIHELQYLDEHPASLENYDLTDYFTLSIRYPHPTDT